MREQLEFFNQLRSTFCSCPECNTFFRLSETKVWDDIKPALDFLDKLDDELRSLEQREKALKIQLQKTKEKATLDGRRDADEYISQFDTLFKPLSLSPNDSKVHFSPIDFVVFNGMNDLVDPKIKNIVLLDSKKNDGKVQQSIRYCVEHEQYDFLTIKIQSDGSVIEE
jgi:predicted Holliday junction resolvase-like endonuclease